jgi:processive 1,2-diacylglycerol beta-glucosyltransferase
MRVMILSAPVGAGHDAAAAALAEELRLTGVDVEVVDGLALLGVERLVVGGYRFQILHAAWSWRLLYRVTRARVVIRLGGTILARFASGRLIDRIAQGQPDVIVSAYPIVSAALAGLRRTARLPYPCATLVTDFDPHPGWIHPDLDANLVVGGPGRTGRPIRPPMASVKMDTNVRARVRDEFGIDTQTRVVLIVGGAWGVGNLEGAARVVAGVSNAHAIVVTGQNERLYRSLTHDVALAGATILGFTDRMPALMAASDVLIQNAAGLTCLEAFGAGLPVVMFDPLAGHGEDNGRFLADAGLVALTRGQTSLRDTLSSAQFWNTDASSLAMRARGLFDRPSPAEAVVALTARQIAQPGHIRRLAPVVAISLALGAWFIGENPLTGYDLTAPTRPSLRARPTPTGGTRRSALMLRGSLQRHASVAGHH